MGRLSCQPANLPPSPAAGNAGSNQERFFHVRFTRITGPSGPPMFHAPPAHSATAACTRCTPENEPCAPEKRKAAGQTRKRLLSNRQAGLVSSLHVRLRRRRTPPGFPARQAEPAAAAGIRPAHAHQMGRPHRGPAPGPLPGLVVGGREELIRDPLMITRNPPDRRTRAEWRSSFHANHPESQTAP